ncbi:Octanoyltransferase [Cyphellophora attinorum]|uniref:Octanoyltransferase n=1 Tax=Cyphellophora attinorum TaxID=1664694 RepID=A0A0N1HFB5_9EURO|nr:Octanoyltransferase [Phialophora attinorum]KPI44392.1 Octanoyltransferase [Phialophora attinorum]
MPAGPLRTRLLHIHLTPRIPYTTSLLIQDQLLNLHWQHRAALKSSTPSPSSPPPPPILLSFSTHPTYTVGRRHLLTNPLSSSQISYLTANDAAAFHPTSRGGLLTYHGPGQCTAYPIIDLRRFGLSARCYVRLLENAVIRTCDGVLERAGAKARTGRSATDPGVWMLKDGAAQPRSDSNSCQPSTEEQADSALPAVSDRKICALGVQVTRGVTAHGVGLNVRDQAIEKRLRKLYYDTEDMTENRRAGYLSYGFSRIVACGLEGKSTTWLSREGVDAGDVNVPCVARELAENIAVGIEETGEKKGLVDGVETVELGRGDVEALKSGSAQIGELSTIERELRRNWQQVEVSVDRTH